MFPGRCQSVQSLRGCLRFSWGRSVRREPTCRDDNRSRDAQSAVARVAALPSAPSPDAHIPFFGGNTRLRDCLLCIAYQLAISESATMAVRRMAEDARRTCQRGWRIDSADLTVAQLRDLMANDSTSLTHTMRLNISLWPSPNDTPRWSTARVGKGSMVIHRGPGTDRDNRPHLLRGEFPDDQHRPHGRYGTHVSTTCPCHPLMYNSPVYASSHLNLS